MRKIYILLLVISFFGFSCSDNEARYTPTEGEREVEIELVHSTQSATRTPVADPGSEEERKISELDLLVFNSTDGTFMYTREAYKLTTGKFRATLTETTGSETLKVYLLANCRTQINAKKSGWTVGTDEWSDIYDDLVDDDPARLVSSAEPQPVILPMWGEHTGQVSTSQVNKWGPILMLRSVASTDLYVEDNTKNADFELKALHLYYAADKGYLPALNGSGTPTQYSVPTGMATTLNTLKATRVGTEVFDAGTADEKEYASISHQMYMYDNNVTAATISATKKFTRVIMEGYYKQGSATPGQEKSSFYPIDFVYSDGTFRPIIRNWKYVFKVSGVNGSGYGSLEEAAENYPIDLDVEVIDWNNEDGEIGIAGQYYVSIARKAAIVERDAGSTDEISLSYRIEDLVPGDEFTLEFKDDSNGTATTVTNGIENDYFRVELIHGANSTAVLKVTALQNYTAGKDKDTVIIKFRNLRFEVSITQLSTSKDDWENGGEIPVEW